MKTFFRKIGSALYKGWMAFAKVLAIVNTTVILTLVYLVLIGPSWLIMKLLGKDLLDRRMPEVPSYWKEKAPLEHTLEEGRHQF